VPTASPAVSNPGPVAAPTRARWGDGPRRMTAILKYASAKWNSQSRSATPPAAVYPWAMDGTPGIRGLVHALGSPTIRSKTGSR